MDRIPALKVPQRHAQLYKKHLLALAVLDKQYCVQKHSDGTVTLPILPTSVKHLNLLSLQSSVDPNGSCEIINIQTPQFSRKGKVKSCRERIIDAVQPLVVSRGEKWKQELEDDIPRGWQRHEDLVLFGEGYFSQKIWTELGCELWLAVSHALGVKRIAQITRVSQDGYRTPVVTMLLGDSSCVAHIDNHIRYEFDVTKCMFSFGNITEKLRIASFNCSGETVVDLYAGIGYFTLPYLVHARARHVHACEWNPDAAAALQRNLQLNKVRERCTVHQGDNRLLSLSDIADRVNLGLIPSSEEGWPVACRLLKRETGGILHIHQNITTPVPHQELHKFSDSQSTDVVDSKEAEKASLKNPRDRVVWYCWAKNTAKSIESLLQEITKKTWATNIKHIEHVKSYAPHINHIVLDLECKPIKYICRQEIDFALPGTLNMFSDIHK
ncbi:tRNA wybutosine-synthesizing protein 2 homolog [Hoplias malabaricus]|uniref:tRNA wybutosine-synthesizing protein 2 homolog n=1 Tax=Hoplias malabaricus TaxID=27720 RepID=UPI003462FDEB